MVPLLVNTSNRAVASPIHARRRNGTNIPKFIKKHLGESKGRTVTLKRILQRKESVLLIRIIIIDDARHGDIAL